MASYKNADVCIPHLKDMAAREADATMRAALRMTIRLLAELPTVEIQEGVNCRECYWWVKKSHQCLHKNGLRGRVLSEMFCSYGSLAPDAMAADEPDEEFNEFVEVLK